LTIQIDTLIFVELEAAFRRMAGSFERPYVVDLGTAGIKEDKPISILSGGYSFLTGRESPVIKQFLCVIQLFPNGEFYRLVQNIILPPPPKF